MNRSQYLVPRLTRAQRLVDRLVAKSLFQALTEIDAENRRIRRSMHLNDIAAVTGAKPERLMAVIDTFRRVGRAFLVLSAGSPEDNPLVELAHESLMRQWETLGQWMEEALQGWCQVKYLYRNFTCSIIKFPRAGPPP
jgi:hypothetical protein